MPDNIKIFALLLTIVAASVKAYPVVMEVNQIIHMYLFQAAALSFWEKKMQVDHIRAFEIENFALYSVF